MSKQKETHRSYWQAESLAQLGLSHFQNALDNGNEKGQGAAITAWHGTIAGH